VWGYGSENIALFQPIQDLRVTVKEENLMAILFCAEHWLIGIDVYVEVCRRQSQDPIKTIPGKVYSNACVFEVVQQ
jgi:hypothetical protein